MISISGRRGKASLCSAALTKPTREKGVDKKITEGIKSRSTGDKRRKIRYLNMRRSKGLNTLLDLSFTAPSSIPKEQVRCRMNCKWDDVTSQGGLSVGSDHIFKVSTYKASLDDFSRPQD